MPLPFTSTHTSTRILSIVGIGIVALFLLTRLYQLTGFPIFSDEAVYINWAQIVADDSSRLFISRVDGKQPLFTWLVAPMLGLTENPLLAGRWVSVLAGALSLAGIYLIGRDLFSPVHGMIAAFLYVVCPYTLFLERLAMYESLLCAFGIWMVRVSLQIATGALSFATGFVALGFLMGFAFLTKATALLLFPVCFFIFLLWGCRKRERFWAYGALSLAIAVAMELPFVFSSQEIVSWSPTTHLLSLETLTAFPWAIWARNALSILYFYTDFLTLPLVTVFAFAVLLAVLKRRKVELALLSWAFFPVWVIGLLGGYFFSWYFLIAIPPLILLAPSAILLLTDLILLKCLPARLAVKGANDPRRWAVLSFLIVIILANVFVFDWKLVRDPLTVPIINPQDRALFFEGEASGYGVSQGAEFLIREAREKKITLLVASNIGNPLEGMLTYLSGNPNVDIIPAPWWGRGRKLMPAQERFPLQPSRYKKRPVVWEETVRLENAYFIYPDTRYPQERFVKENPEFKKVWSYAKPGRNYSVDIFRHMKN